jgi:uncharacterized repeat protein (TIGR03803 family)
MKRKLLGKFAPGWAAGFYFLALSSLGFSSAAAADLQILHGSAPAISAQLTAVESLQETQRLDLAIALPLRNQAELATLLQQVYDPASPNFRHYLTPEQFTARFGPTAEDYGALLAYAKSNGLSITGTHANRTLLDVNGSVGTINRAFHVRLRKYHHPRENRDFFAPDQEPSLTLNAPVLAVDGLSDYERPHPMQVLTNFFSQPYATSPWVTGSGPRGNFIGRDFRNAYAPGMTEDGSGQAVGLFELDGYFPNDVASYENLAGLAPVPLTNVLVNGFHQVTPSGNNVEVALDIVMTIAMAPALSQAIVYEGRTPNSVLNRMATDNLARQLSCSWGFGSEIDPVREQIFEQFAAQGQSFFQASGDVGGGVIYPPSDDAFATVVGGTSLTTNPTNGAWLAESAWPYSSGGISSAIPIPPWQQGVNMTANHGSTTFRNVPDVACLADAQIWLFADNGAEGVVGGTSAAAPLWAGYAALLNQQAAAQGEPAVGYLNPALYGIGQGPVYASAFHDITVGTTTNSASPLNFFAVPGYDLCTGWGTPNGTNLANALRPSPDALQISPATAVTFGGLPGGPFAPTSQTIRLLNTGTNALTWSLGSTSAWFSATPASGSLPAGGTANVTVTPAMPMNTLPAGSYQATIFFANLNDGFSLNRQVAINIANPVITADGVVFSNLYSFNGLADGTGPNGLVQGSNGVLYGTTQNGGSNQCGALFELTTNGAFASLAAFAGGSGGANPFAPLIPGPDGKFYGTTFHGGAFDNGTIFAATPAGTITPLQSFDSTNGALPYAPLIGGSNGIFYGSAYLGGAAAHGTVFQFTTNGGATALYSFANGSDGGNPAGGLVLGTDGTLYGTTWRGGGYSQGTVFSLSTNGTLTTLASLSGTNGTFPAAGLTPDADGNLFGAASQGGVSNAGAIFEINAAGQFTNLYSFSGGADGANPRAALLLGNDGNLYGTTANGGTYGQGTLFVISPDGGLTTLVAFNGWSGANPQAALAQGGDGYLYGATQNGGANGKGTLFRVGVSSAPQITSQPAARSVFAGANVQFHVAVLGTSPLTYQWQRNGTNLADGGEISGANQRILALTSVTAGDIGAYSVIVSNLLGSVTSSNVSLTVTSSPPFIVTQSTNQLVPAGATAVLNVTALGNLPLLYQWKKDGVNLTNNATFSGVTTATLAVNNLSIANVGNYVVTVTNSLGGLISSNIALSVLENSAPGTVLSTLHWFSLTNGGWAPNGSAINLTAGSDGNIYGTTPLGSLAGGTGGGTVFKLTTNGQFTTLAAFNESNSVIGFSPAAALVEDTNGNFYGTAQQGGTNSLGTIFQLTPQNVLSNVYSFAGTNDGANPSTPLTDAGDGGFYGIGNGGDYGLGNVFRLSPDGAFANLYSFSGTNNGTFPVGGVLRGIDGNLYGMTGQGGAAGYGTIFKLATNGVLTTLHNFTGGADGYAPMGILAQNSDGSLYGVTEYNVFFGLPFYGTIFKVTTNGTFSTVYTINYTDGAYPRAGLLLGSDGNFYGTAYGNLIGPVISGPAVGNGTVFQITPGGAITTLVAFDGFDNGAHPLAPLVEGMDGALYGTTTVGGPAGHGTLFRLSFNTAPLITSQPANEIIAVGASASFSVAVTATPARYYQWQKNGTNLADGANILGATNRVLTLTNASLADSGNYSVVVSNVLGSILSSNALLTVAVPPVFQTYAITNRTVNLKWSALAGLKYQLQYTASLSPASWNNLGNAITASNGVLTATDTMGTPARRFYRVAVTQ